MSNFEFDPNDIRLKVGLPLRLRLVNVSNGGHDFSAPSLFAASRLPPSTSSPPNGTVEVPAHQTVEIGLVPQVPGKYSLECTHILHSAFVMQGTIEVML
jgi:plastocyanin